MQGVISVRKLVEEKSSQEGEGFIQKSLWRLGAGALIAGGIAYLWYRNSSLRAYHHLGDDQFLDLDFKIQNKIFLDTYSLARKNFSKIVIQIRKDNPAATLDFNDPATRARFNDGSEPIARKFLFPRISEELKRSDHPKLSIKHYHLKAFSIQTAVQKKVAEQLALTQKEQDFMNMRFGCSGVWCGMIVQAFQMFSIGSQADALDHKECLQLLVDYEIESLEAYADLFHRFVFLEGNRDLNARTEEFNKIFEERLKMQRLIDYSVEKLGERYSELPESERYHPLFLFLNKALIPPQNAGYTKMDIILVISMILMDNQVLMQAFMTKTQNPVPVVTLKERIRTQLARPYCKRALEVIGVKFELFKD